MAYEKNFNEQRGSNESLFSKRIKAGKRRTYFFDVKATRGNDYFITITESKKRFEDDGYERHKLFLYKEDFQKFIDCLTDTVNFVKTDLMPDFDFNSFNHAEDDNFNSANQIVENNNDAIIDMTVNSVTSVDNTATQNTVQHDFSEVDEWKM